MSTEQQAQQGQAGQQSGQSSSQQGSQSSQGQGNAAQGGASSQASGSQGTTNENNQQQAARPEWVPENFWDKDKAEVKGADLRKTFDENMAFRAAEDSKRLSRPQKPEDYKAELPTDWKAPEGLEFKLNADDPMIAQYRSLAIEAGLDQPTFSKGLGLIAAIRVGEAQQIKTAFDAEVAKLGATGTARVDTVTNWLRAMGGNDAEPLANILKLAPVASTITALETLMKKFSSQGAGSFSQLHREGTSAWDETAYVNSGPPGSPARMEYAAKHGKPAPQPNGRAA